MISTGGGWDGLVLECFFSAAGFDGSIWQIPISEMARFAEAHSHCYRHVIENEASEYPALARPGTASSLVRPIPVKIGLVASPDRLASTAAGTSLRPKSTPN